MRNRENQPDFKDMPQPDMSGNALKISYDFRRSLKISRDSVDLDLRKLHAEKICHGDHFADSNS